MKRKVERTERGWPGHYILARSCLFCRNTLLECGEKRIVVSTVGSKFGRDGEIEQVGPGRYYETMAFPAEKDGPYWEAVPCDQIKFESPWCIDHHREGSDLQADDMHEAVVAELSKKLAGSK